MNSHRFRTWGVLLAAFFCPAISNGVDRGVDPTFLHREISAVKETAAGITTATCHYKPLFGEGDRDKTVVIGVARFAELILDPNGDCATREYPEEDQVYVMLEGSGSVKYGNENVPLNKEDYLYIPAPCRIA